MKRITSALLALGLSAPLPAIAAPPAAGASAPAAAAALTYRAFLAEVAHGNLELQAQRLSIPIAEAQVAIAKIFPDPTLTAGVAAVDVSNKGAPLATTVGLSYTFELGGKRSARVAAAEAEREQVKAELEDTFRTLRSGATNAFIDCLYARLVLDRKQQTQRGLEKLVSVNQERARAGDIGNVPLTQSRVEARRSQGEVLAAEADVTAADLALVAFVGSPKAGPIGAPVGDLKIKPRTFNIDALIAQAKANRPDLLAKQRAAESAMAKVDLAHANRWIDLTLNVGWQHSFPATGPFLAPAYDSLATTVSVPLPLSRVYRGELDGALAAEAQGKTLMQSVTLKIEVEVRQAYARYKAAVSRVGLYTGGLLADADQVLEATLFTYQRGGATLLEVLEAQRTDNDVYLTYYDALADHAKSLVALEQAAGIWDIDF